MTVRAGDRRSSDGWPSRLAATRWGGAPALVWLVSGAVAVAAVAIYLFAYPFHDIQPAGFDVHAYEWQAKAVGHGSLSVVGARPGLPVMAALLGSVVHVDVAGQIVVLMPMLGLVLALAVAAGLRVAFRLSAWALPVVVALMALYPGTARVVHGYQASLLFMVIATAGVAVLVLAEGRTGRLLAAGALFTAACLTHVVLFAIFAAIAGLYVLLSVPAFLRERRDGTPVLATDAGAAAATVLSGGVLGAAAIYGWLAVRPGSTINTSNVVNVLQQRTLQEVRRIRPYLIGPLAVVGGLFLRHERPAAGPPRVQRAARAMARVGAAWLAVTVAGTVAGLIRESVPGHRFLLFSPPLPALAGLGVAGLGALILRWRSAVRIVAAVAVVVVLTVLVAAGGVSYFYNRTYPRTDPVYGQLRAAGVYLERYGDGLPVVFVLDRRGAVAVTSVKFRSYVIKGEMPADVVARTLIYPGKLEDLEAGRPTILPETASWERSFNTASRQAWAQIEPALREGAIVMIAQRFAADPFRAAIARDPSRRIAPGLYLVRGPLHALGVLPPAPRFGIVPGALSAAAMFLLLALVGFGAARTALAGAEPTVLDLVALSPAVGAGLAVLAGFLVAAAGGDPRGPLGLVVMLGLSVGSATLARSGRRVAPTPERPARSPAAPGRVA